MSYRIEIDALGKINVPSDKLWGAQTQRSLNNFQIGPPGSMPDEIINAFGIIKKAVAITNYTYGLLSAEKKDLIIQVCDEIIEGRLKEHFPLVIWQTGSGTHTNMNCNEVIANRAKQLIENSTGKKHTEISTIHPNDDANKSQSSNDTFSSAMHIAAYKMLCNKMIPSLSILKDSFEEKSSEFHSIVKIGRTHCMDAVPVTLGQEFSGFASQVNQGLQALNESLPKLSELALGGTAVGTGLNTPEGFDREAVSQIAQLSHFPFIPAKNKFAALSSHDAILQAHGAIKALATSLMKISNDIRMLSSGPKAGLGELKLPENEPGSSIMPGKVNPTQIEALTMVCTQIIGNDVSITLANSLGHFELNVFKPVIIANMLESIALLSDACKSFNDNCLKGIMPNRENINKQLNNSLMLVTALAPHIGYDKAGKIARKAYDEGISLKEASIQLGITDYEYDKWLIPENMTHPSKKTNS